MAHIRGDVSDLAQVDSTARIWDLAQVREHAKVGAHCVVGRGAYIGTGVLVGDNCKIQNYALVYEPAVLEDGVFIGPAAVLTNDRFPRAVNPDLTLKSHADWDPVGVTVRTGASIGARTVCIAPVVVGEWAVIGSGAVVTRDVPAHALVVGNPARQIGWVGRSGRRLEPLPDGRWRCPATDETYELANGTLSLEVRA